MLSICIPVYNFDIVSLVSELQNQTSNLNYKIEIIVVDDKSDNIFIDINNEIEQFANVKYIKLETNVGRSRIRNILANEAQFNYLLFLDCDSQVEHSFLSNYLQAIQTQNPLVICGGTVHPKICPAPNKTLRWKAGRKREDSTAEQRINSKLKYFASNNFVIQKQLFKNIGFDERIKKYGHEDTLFGCQLQQKGIEVCHIENAVVHIGIDTNSEFIHKTEHAIENLVQLLKEPEYSLVLEKRIKILHYLNLIKRYKISWVIACLFRISKSIIKRNLLSSKPNLLLFDFYKIGYLVSLQ